MLKNLVEAEHTVGFWNFFNLIRNNNKQIHEYVLYVANKHSIGLANLPCPIILGNLQGPEASNYMQVVYRNIINWIGITFRSQFYKYGLSEVVINERNGYDIVVINLDQTYHLCEQKSTGKASGFTGSSNSSKSPLTLGFYHKFDDYIISDIGLLFADIRDLSYGWSRTYKDVPEDEIANKTKISVLSTLVVDKDNWKVAFGSTTPKDKHIWHSTVSCRSTKKENIKIVKEKSEKRVGRPKGSKNKPKFLQVSV